MLTWGTVSLPVENLDAMTTGPDGEMECGPPTASGAPWALEAVRNRIEKRAAELGKSPRSLPSAYRKSWRENGPSLRLLEEIARALDWTLPELLGIKVADPIPLALALGALRILTADKECPLHEPEESAEILSDLYGWFEIFLRHASQSEAQRAVQSVAMHVKRKSARDRAGASHSGKI